MAELVYGRVQQPTWINRIVTDAETGAWNNLGDCDPWGVCQHSMVGTLWGTDGWFRRGRGVSTGLTHFGVGNSSDGPDWDGKILRWNDPTGAASNGVSPNRAGWANGGSDGLEGDGPLYVRTLGVNAINRNLVSIERSDGGNTNTAMSTKQFESICQLTAYWFDQAQVPWDKYPLNPRFGIVTHLLHFEFATKSCPHNPVTSRIDEIQNRVRAILKAAQTATAAGEPIPPPNPPAPDHDAWPYDLDELKAHFGSFTYLYKSGRVKEATWDDQGAISNTWAQRAHAEGIKKVSQIPAPLVGMEAIDAERNLQTVVLFDGRGTTTWQLSRVRIGAVWEWTK